MKALFLIDNDRIADIARFYLKPLGFETVRYRNPAKAADNLEEIDPDAIIISARDFPRHWKVIARMVRSVKGKDQCIIILLKGETFTVEEAAKATELEVNGVVRDDLDDRREQARFQQLLKRYIVVEEDRAAERIQPAAWDKLDFIFSHPRTLAPISGRLELVSLTGLSFIPDSPALVDDLSAGELIEDCSMRVGPDILDLACIVAHPGRVLGLEIHQMAEGDKAKLEGYLAACPEREIAEILKQRDEDREE